VGNRVGNIMEISIRLGEEKDIDEISKLYDDVGDFLTLNQAKPAWKKGIYPTLEDAVMGVDEKALYVAVINNKIIGSIILRHKPEPAYDEVNWQKEVGYEKVFVIYTLGVHPEYMKHGVGGALLDFAENYGKSREVCSLRLDVYEGNLPAIQLYEKCGFQHVGTVDLDLECYGLKWFRLYEKLI
jgi:ribosomal protein S18 acetylase RimI-like enzyme